MSEVLVSISCITYNHSAYIRQCLDGMLMQQTTFDFEILIHDDCSTDGTDDIIREYASKYPKIIKPLFEEENQYQQGKPIGTAVWNLPRAKGKYIAFCEGDDYWTDPLKLQKQVDFMEANPEYGLCYTDYNFCDEFGNITEESHFKSSQCKPILTFEEHLFSQGYIAPMSWLYRKDVYKSITNDMLQGTSDGTYVLALEFFAKSKVAYLSDTTATYRVHQGSASRPTSLQKRFNYLKGVYDTEMHYAIKYSMHKDVLCFIKKDEFLELLPIALKINNEEYINASIKYSKEHNIDISRAYIQYQIEKELVSIKRSYAYRIGKLIVKPFSLLRKLLGK